MNKKNLIIVTGAGEHLGTGHVQRMLTLVSYIQIKNEFNPLILTNNPEDLPKEFQHLAISSIPNCSLIIRDKRDSSEDEIVDLKKYAPLIAVDDTGKGRSRADYVIDLLPNLKHRLSREFYKEDLFLYGYNFTREIKTALEKIKEKSIDIAIYTGSRPKNSVTESLLAILPKKAQICHLTGKGTVDFFTHNPVYKNLTFPEILLSSKILITHFGITLFEGYASGCRLFTINPSQYHKDLTALVEKKMNITDLDALIETNNAKIELEKVLWENDSYKIPDKKDLNSLLKGVENFYSLIQSIIHT